MGVPVFKPQPKEKKAKAGLKQTSPLKRKTGLKQNSSLNRSQAKLNSSYKMTKALQQKKPLESTYKEVPPEIVAEVIARDGDVCLHPGCSNPATENHHVFFKSGASSQWKHDIKNIFRFCFWHHTPTIHCDDNWRRFWELVAVIRFGWLGGRAMTLEEYCGLRKLGFNFAGLFDKLLYFRRSRPSDVKKILIVKEVEAVMTKASTDGYRRGGTIYNTVRQMKGKIVEKADFGEGVVVVSVQWENGQLSNFQLNPKVDLLVQDGDAGQATGQLLN